LGSTAADCQTVLAPVMKTNAPAISIQPGRSAARSACRRQ